MVDIATLGLAVDSSQVNKAAADLRLFESIAKRTGETVEQVQARFSKTTGAIAQTGVQAKTAAASLSPLNTQINQSIAPIERMHAAFSRLTNLLVSGIIASAVRMLVRDLVNLNTEIANIGKASSFSGINTQSMQGLQSAFRIAGGDASKMLDMMVDFNRQADLARNGIGSLAALFRANGLSIKDSETALYALADLVARAATEAQKFSIVQQAGLSPTKEMVRLLEQGSVAIQAQVAETRKFSAEQIRLAEQADREWNKLVENFSRGMKTAVVTAYGLLKDLAKGWGGVPNATAVPVIPVTSAPLPPVTGQKTADPELMKQRMALEQQRISVLGQLATVTDVVRAKELELATAGLNGAGVSKQQRDAILNIVRAQEELNRINQQAQIGIFNIAAATTQAGRELQGWIDRKLLDPTNAQQMAAAHEVLAKRIKATAEQASIAAAPFEKLKRLEIEAGNTRGLIDQFATTSLNNLSTALTDITMGTVSARDGFRNLGIQVLRSLTEMIIKMTILLPIAQALQSVMGGSGFLGLLGFGSVSTGSQAFNILSPMYHTGGIVGSEGGGSRYIHPAYFENAPRFHSGGLVGGEVPIIAKKGEGVFTQGQMAALGKGGGPSIVINNAPVFNNSDPASEARMRAFIAANSKQLEQKIKSDVVKSNFGYAL